MHISQLLRLPLNLLLVLEELVQAEICLNLSIPINVVRKLLTFEFAEILAHVEISAVTASTFHQVTIVPISTTISSIITSVKSLHFGLLEHGHVSIQLVLLEAPQLLFVEQTPLIGLLVEYVPSHVPLTDLRA